MINGILIVNKFLNTHKFNELYEWLTDAATRHNVRLTVMTNADYLVRCDISSSDGASISELIDPPFPKCDFVLFWDKDANLARAIEKQGIRVFNSADAIEACDDKAKTFERLQGAVRMPKTFRIPMTFSGIGYTDTDFINKIQSILGYPFVIKENCGSLGGQVYLVHDKDEAVNTLNKTFGRPSIAQEFISDNSGKDIRIHTVGDKIITSMMRFNEHDFRANISNGGSMLPYEPTEEQCRMALKVSKLLGLDFAGVDILIGPNDEPILCEVNSNAHFRNIYDCTGVNVADSIMEHILSKCTMW